MLLYSAHYTDQDGNAARLAYHGLGILGNDQTDSVNQIKENLNRIFQDDSFKKNMHKFKDLYQHYELRKLTPLLLN